MPRFIRCTYERAAGTPAERARILDGHATPEGLHVERARFVAEGALSLEPSSGHLVSPTHGEGTLCVGAERLRLGHGVHAYVPPGADARLEAGPGLGFAHVWGGQARGREVRVRDEAFVYAAAVGERSLRWTLTPQYLSRRIFLHHDEALCSAAGRPVSWFRTTMFDVDGLPHSDEGEPVFKMAYHSRTEFNVCYAVRGEARVRMARHPYGDAGQTWDAWTHVDGETTYHLDEAEADASVEWIDDGGVRRPRRNKHEVFARGGYVTLFCLFDPAPTGVERHQPGAYSDYEALDVVAARPEYAAHRDAHAAFDAAIDALSLARARGLAEGAWPEAHRATLEAGRVAQEGIEDALLATLPAARRAVVAPWSRRGEGALVEAGDPSASG